MEFIDLGLSVKWAKCNIGASNPEEYGYDFPNNEGISFTNTEIIRLPTKEEAEELCKECTWELQTHAKGKYEWKVTGKNGNYILLPASYKEHGVEWRVGIHNIFKLVEVDYVRRVTYLNNPNTNKWGIRFKVRMTF